MVFNMENFFELQFEMKKDEVFIEAINDYPEQLIKIGKFIPEEPFNMRISEGKKYFDIIRFQDVFNFAISRRLYDILKKENITGWDAYKIDIQNTQNDYYGFQVTGKSNNILRPIKKGFVTGQNFDYSTWDGSDFFCPEGTMLIFCTQKVKDLFASNHITNVQFQDIKTVKWYNV